mmetsp:Transcript_27867/g.45356  ORF Transcript_27867/g.45356 Transcript_27867/m.45356 type:complete len:127 (-) Transcript_27867:30-410(-)
MPWKKLIELMGSLSPKLVGILNIGLFRQFYSLDVKKFFTAKSKKIQNGVSMKDLFYRHHFNLDGVAAFFTEEMEKRVEASERLQHQCIGNHITDRLKNFSIVEIVLGYISVINIPENSYVAKAVFG